MKGLFGEDLPLPKPKFEIKMKLKTLKDFEKKGIFRNKEIKFVEIYNLALEEARTEAIKWAKEYKMSPFGTFCVFHNITPEDLK